jgi:hypothetical protein
MTLTDSFALSFDGSFPFASCLARIPAYEARERLRPAPQRFQQGSWI